MPVKDKLQIFLITYNRADCLKKTLEQVLADNSPIKDYDITILDNASMDNTQEVCKNICDYYPNINYIRNKINVGISGNIIKAMELASKEWFWIICDDDEFNWTNWKEIEDAIISDEYDIVHTTYPEGLRTQEYAYLINEEAFLPTSIYRTALIDTNIMQNAYAMTYLLLPHHAIGCKVINKNGKIFVPQIRHVIQGNPHGSDWFRAEREGMFHRLNNYQLLAGYIGAYTLIQDPQKKEKCCSVLCMGSSFYKSMKWFVRSNPGQDLYNVFEILLTVNDKQKGELVKLLYTNKYINYEKLMTFLTIKHIKYKILKFFFNCYKDETNKYITILGIQITIKRRKKCKSR